MDYYAMGQRIRRLRKAKCLTLEQLAEMADMSASFLGHIERGSRIASLETLVKLCRVLETSPNELLGGMFSEQCARLPEKITISPGALLDELAAWFSTQEIR